MDFHLKVGICEFQMLIFVCLFGFIRELFQKCGFFLEFQALKSKIRVYFLFYKSHLQKLICHHHQHQHLHTIIITFTPPPPLLFLFLLSLPQPLLALPPPPPPPPSSSLYNNHCFQCHNHHCCCHHLHNLYDHCFYTSSTHCCCRHHHMSLLSFSPPPLPL